MAQATIDVDKLSGLQGIVARQISLAKAILADTAEARQSCPDVRDWGDMDALTYLKLESTWIDQRFEQIRLEQLEQATLIALQSALALPAGAPVIGT